MSLTFIGQQMTLYSGYLSWLTGFLGNGMNVIVFLTMRTYRITPCTFYFLIGSIMNILFLTIVLTTRILAIGYDLDFSRQSIIWCKMRFFLVYSLSLMTLTCSTLSIIDQYLITSENVHIRRLSSIKNAHRLVIIFGFVWLIHAIPSAIYRDIVPLTKTCVNTNTSYAVYSVVYIIGLLCLIPISIMIFFGYLTYRNINGRRAAIRRGFDRQTLRMTLFLVILNVICLLPYGIYIAYQVITSSLVKDNDRLIKENFALTIVTLVSYFYYSVSEKLE